MELNEYIANAVKNETREYAERRRARLERDAEAKRKLDERIHDHPEDRDVMNGDALNAKLQHLLAPSVSDSASQYARVPLDAEVIRRIPFKLDEKGARFSMIRLSLKGPQKWPIAFQDDRFAIYHRAYERCRRQRPGAGDRWQDDGRGHQGPREGRRPARSQAEAHPGPAGSGRNQRLYHEAKEAGRSAPGGRAGSSRPPRSRKSSPRSTPTPARPSTTSACSCGGTTSGSGPRIAPTRGPSIPSSTRRSSNRPRRRPEWNERPGREA